MDYIVLVILLLRSTSNKLYCRVLVVLLLVLVYRSSMWAVEY